MPLRALANGRDVFSFEHDQDSWRELKKCALKLPCCGVRAIPKTSELGNFFFAHYRRQNCSAASEGPEHIYLKSLIAKSAISNGYDVTTEKSGETPNGERWIADVFCQKGEARLAIEVQWSYQTRQEFFRRQEKYADSGIRAAWIFKLRNDKEYSKNELPYDHKNPVFGIKHKPKSKALYVPQFDMPIEDFIDGMVSKKLKWVHQPKIGTQLTAKIHSVLRRCPHCREQTGMVIGIEVYDMDGNFLDRKSLGTKSFRDDGLPALIVENMDRSKFGNFKIGDVKVEFDKYMANSRLYCSCFNCDMQLNTRHLLKSYFGYAEKHSLPVLNEFVFAYGDHSIQIKSDWFFCGKRSKEYF